MDTDIRTLSSIKVPQVSPFAKVYRTSKDNIVIILVGIGDPKDNELLVVFSVPGWDNPLNAQAILHSTTIHREGKDIELYNDEFAASHNSIYGRDGFWRYQIHVCLPGIGERIAILDEDASAKVKTTDILNCYLSGMKYHFLDEKRKFRKKRRAG